MVGYALYVVAKGLTHLSRKIKLKLSFHNVSDTALAGLGVDTDNICLVHSANIPGINGKIRHSPYAVRLALSALHTLSDSILM